MAFAILATLWSAYENDWTTDEPMHLEWSRRLLEEGKTERRSQLHFNSKTPVTMLNQAARRFARGSLGVRDPRKARLAARVPSLLWLGVVLAATFWLARHCAGPVAAHLATLAAALDPNLIAHSSIATVDTAYAAATLLTIIAALAFARRPGLAAGAALGLSLGLAFSVKFTAFLLIPGVLLLPLGMRDGAKRLWAARGPALAGAAAALATSAAVVCASYLFIEVGVPLGQVAWRSRPLAALAAAVPALSLPLPVDFLTGLDICLKSERTRAYNVVVFGERFPSGVFYYFAVGWLLKTPLLLLLGLFLGLARAVREKRVVADPALRYVGAAPPHRPRLLLLHLPDADRLSLRSHVRAPRRHPRRRGTGRPGGAPALSCRHRPRGADRLAENAAYLGNSLAFTNAAVWPKRYVYRLLADSNVDYGQNRDKMAAWLEAHPNPGRHFEPIHLLPGENVLRFDQATSARGFPRHEWLRAHLRPYRHFRHNYLFFEASPLDFERFLEESRRRPALPQAEALCAVDERRGTSADLAAEASFVGRLREGEAYLLCVRAAGTSDLALRAWEGEVLYGPADRPLRDGDRLRDGKEVWYRLAPGVHGFVAKPLDGFRGEWIVRGGPLTASVRTAKLDRRGLHPREWKRPPNGRLLGDLAPSPGGK